MFIKSRSQGHENAAMHDLGILGKPRRSRDFTSRWFPPVAPQPSYCSSTHRNKRITLLENVQGKKNKIVGRGIRGETKTNGRRSSCNVRDWSFIMGRGATKRENRGSETFCAPPPPSRQGKTFRIPPFKEWKLFAPHLQYGQNF